MHVLAAAFAAVLLAGCERQSVTVYPTWKDRDGIEKTFQRQMYTAVVERQEVIANDVFGLHSLAACESWETGCAGRSCVVQDTFNWRCQRDNADRSVRVYEMSGGNYAEYPLDAPSADFRSYVSAPRWFWIKAREMWDCKPMARHNVVKE